jgi:hypothetical protein
MLREKKDIPFPVVKIFRLAAAIKLFSVEELIPPDKVGGHVRA